MWANSAILYLFKTHTPLPMNRLVSWRIFRWRAWFFWKEKSQIFIPSTWPQITFRSTQLKNQKQRFCSKANFGSWKYCSYKTTGRLCQTKWLSWRRFTWNCQKFNLWNWRSWLGRSKYLSKSWSQGWFHFWEKKFFSRTEILRIYFENFLLTPGQTCPSGRDVAPKA